MNWYLTALKRFGDFSGRSRRREYWWFILMVWVLAIVLFFVDLTLGTGSETGYGLFSGLFSLAMFVPLLSVSVRRLHDTGRSGLWLLILFVPILGALAILVLALLDGQPGDNRFGPNPKGA
ncbi:MAG: DUF805 domain-containing protein [Gemmatimonadota bacterium]